MDLVMVSVPPGPEGREFLGNLRIFPGLDQPRAILRALDTYGWGVLWIDPGVRAVGPVSIPAVAGGGYDLGICPWSDPPFQSSPLVADPSVMVANDTPGARMLLERWVEMGGGDRPEVFSRALMTETRPFRVCCFPADSLFGWEEGGGAALIREFDTAGFWD